MAGLQGTIRRRRGFRPRRLLRVGLLLVCLLAVLPATASAAVVTEFSVPTPNSQPAGITVGPDGAIWFTEENGHKIGRITTDGAITEYQIPTFPSTPGEITAGPDGNLWFTEFGANPPKVGRLTTAGVFTEWELPLGAAPDGITAGPDGAIWFTHNGGNKIGRITTDGTQLDEYPLPRGWRPGDIAPGPDGRLWFTESEANKVGAIRPGNPPAIEEFDVPGSDPSGIAASGGSIWFTMHGLDMVGRMSTLGQSLEQFGPTGRGPSGIALGPDGALWFTETEANKIARMTTTGRITEYTLPFDPIGPNAPEEIVAGPDGAMWFTEHGVNKIGRVEAGSSTSVFVPPPRPPPLQITTTKTSKPVRKACRVPRVRGLRIGKARKKMRRAKCRFRIRGKGRVYSVRPRAGVRTRATVRLKAKRR
jgi:streptogramin lyase